MLVVTKRDYKMLSRLYARTEILKARIAAASLADDSEIRAELHSLEWAIAKLTGATP